MSKCYCIIALGAYRAIGTHGPLRACGAIGTYGTHKANGKYETNLIEL